MQILRSGSGPSTSCCGGLLTSLLLFTFPDGELGFRRPAASVALPYPRERRMFCHALCVGEVMRSTEQSEICGWDATREAARLDKEKRWFRNHSRNMGRARRKWSSREMISYKWLESGSAHSRQQCKWVCLPQEGAWCHVIQTKNKYG